MVRLRAKSEAQNVPRINTFQFLLVRLKGLGGEIISPPKVIGKKKGGNWRGYLMRVKQCAVVGKL